MSKWRKLDRPCPNCASPSLEETMFSWHGKTPDGCPTGGITFPVRCTACNAKFVRLEGEDLLAPEVAAERERQRQENAYSWWKEIRNQSSADEDPQMSDAQVLDKLIAEGVISREEVDVDSFRSEYR